MSLSAGTRLGPYEILAPLGAGGMGEVYPQALFDVSGTISPSQVYTATPDGQRFLVGASQDTDRSPIVVMVNWQEELKARVPAK